MWRERQAPTEIQPDVRPVHTDQGEEIIALDAHDLQRIERLVKGTRYYVRTAQLARVRRSSNVRALVPTIRFTSVLTDIIANNSVDLEPEYIFANGVALCGPISAYTVLVDEAE